MAFFNFFSHGTQDLYPTFLKMQHGFDPHLISIIAIFITLPPCSAVFSTVRYRNVLGVKAIMIAAFLALPVLPLWAFSSGSFTIGRRVPDAVYGAGRTGVVPTAKRAGSGECARRAAGLFTNSVIYWRRLMRRYRPASRKRMVEITGWQWRSWLARWLF